VTECTNSNNLKASLYFKGTGNISAVRLSIKTILCKCSFTTTGN